MTDTGPDEGTTLATYVQASADDPFVDECQERAEQLVADYLGGPGVQRVPVTVLRAAVLEVGADLFHRRRTRNGVTQFTGQGDATPATLRINRDPLTAAYGILRPYAGPPIG